MSAVAPCSIINFEIVVKNLKDMRKYYCSICKQDTPCSVYNWGVECNGEIIHNLKINIMKDTYKLAEALINIRLGIRKTNKVNTFKSK